jgi:hypothetical protein
VSNRNRAVKRLVVLVIVVSGFLAVTGPAAADPPVSGFCAYWGPNYSYVFPDGTVLRCR